MISLSLFIMFHTDIPVIGNLWLCGNWMVLGVLSCMLLIHLDRRWRARLPDTFQSLVMRFLACVTLGPVIFVELFAISMSLWPAALQGNGLDTMLWFKMWVLSIMQVGTWAMLYFLIESRILRAQAQRTAAEAREQWTQMALQTLHQQLHPHFLFNAINSISNVVDENPERAQVLLYDLSTLLRDALEGHRLDLVPMQRELELLHTYLNLEEARWEDKLCVQLSVEPETRSTLVPWMAVQTLVENAIKHAHRTDKDARHVTIRIWREEHEVHVHIVNEGDLHTSHAPGTGVGLSNLRARLERLYPKGASLHVEQRESRVHAMLTLPTEHYP